MISEKIISVWISLWPSPCVERVRISFHRHIPILDLPGRDFLKIYVGAFLIGILIAFLIRVLLRQPHYGPILESAPLDQYETAYLAGEEERALHAALVSLFHRGLLVVNKEDKSFSTQGELPSSAHFLEKTIFRAAQGEILTIEELKKATAPLLLFLHQILIRSSALSGLNHTPQNRIRTISNYNGTSEAQKNEYPHEYLNYKRVAFVDDFITFLVESSLDKII